MREETGRRIRLVHVRSIPRSFGMYERRKIICVKADCCPHHVTLCEETTGTKLLALRPLIQNTILGTMSNVNGKISQDFLRVHLQL